MAAEQIDTIVGAHVELKGSLHNSGSIQILGHVTGDIHSEATVIVGEGAVVHGPVKAKVVEIAGQVHGAITADEQIELLPKSLVQGDLSTKRLSIKPGALFIGKSNMPGGEFPEYTEDLALKKKPRLEVE